MAKARKTTTPGLKVYNIGPLSKPYYLYHEVTSAGGVVFRLVCGSSSNPHAINLAADSKYAIVRHDHGIHSSLLVHKLPRSHRILGDEVVPEGNDDPIEESDCTCGPGYDTVSPCPPDSIMACDATQMKTTCVPLGKLNR